MSTPAASAANAPPKAPHAQAGVGGAATTAATPVSSSSSTSVAPGAHPSATASSNSAPAAAVNPAAAAAAAAAAARSRSAALAALSARRKKLIRLELADRRAACKPHIHAPFQSDKDLFERMHVFHVRKNTQKTIRVDGANACRDD
jgi:hypothetical protein